MILSGLGAATDVTRDRRHRDANRWARDDRTASREPETASSVAQEEPAKFDAPYFASRFKAEIWRLGALTEEPSPQPQGDGDHKLFDFFGHLSVLLLAVRDGDIDRAREAADALEMDLLAGVGAGPVADSPGALARAGDFARLLSAARAVDAPVARDAAIEEAPVGSVVYDTLRHYLADDAPSV